jgi:RNA polymerase sigma-70 factor (ECF subfamily)
MVERKRLVASLLQQIESLPALQREAFLLREEAGLLLEEIALTTGVTTETAKSRLRYAVAKLRDGLRGLR